MSTLSTWSVVVINLTSLTPYSLISLAFPYPEVRPEMALQIHYTQPGGITGHFMLLIMVIMYVFF